MHSAVDCSIGLPRRPTSASRMLSFVTPPEVSRSFTVSPGRESGGYATANRAAVHSSHERAAPRSDTSDQIPTRNSTRSSRRVPRRSRSGTTAELHEVRVLPQAAQRLVLDVGDAAIARDRSQLRDQRGGILSAGITSRLE